MRRERRETKWKYKKGAVEKGEMGGQRWKQLEEGGVKNKEASTSLTFAIWTALGNSFKQEMGIRSCLVPVRVLRQNKNALEQRLKGDSRTKLGHLKGRNTVTLKKSGHFLGLSSHQCWVNSWLDEFEDLFQPKQFHGSMTVKNSYIQPRKSDPCKV